MRMKAEISSIETPKAVVLEAAGNDYKIENEE
jgi:hypothetical protein